MKEVNTKLFNFEKIKKYFGEKKYEKLLVVNK